MSTEEMTDKQLKLARAAKRVALEEAGSYRQLATIVGLSRSAPIHWEVVPAEHVPAISEATGVRRRWLRPDLYEE